MEEEEKTGKQKETKEDRYSLLKLCLKGSMNRPSELQEIMTGALRAAYLNKKNPEVQSEAVALIEGLEQLFDDENIKSDVFRGILRLAYRAVDQCISQDTAREPSPATPQKLPAFIPLMLKKIIQGWDAEMKPASCTRCLTCDPKDREMYPDASECFQLMIDAYRLGVAKSPIHSAINKEINDIFKEHLERAHGYWRFVPDALRKWACSSNTPNHFAIMLAKARIRFLFSDHAIAELKYLSDLGYYEMSKKERDFLLSVAARKKAGLPAERNG